MYGLKPPVPGHGNTDELLGFMAPSASAHQSIVNVDVSTEIAAVPYRKTIIIQPQAAIWLSIGTHAVAGQCLQLPAFSMFGVDVYSNVPVYAMAVSGIAPVCVVQLSQAPVE
jgi:hypothetical protein